MKVVFTVDNFFYRDELGNIYSKGLYPYNIWERYLTVFDEITVLARVKDINNEDIINDYNLSSGNNVKFVSIPALNSLTNLKKNKRLATKLIQNNIQENDCIIARIPSEISSLSIEIAKNLDKPWAVEVVSCAWDAYWNHGTLKGKIFAPFAFFRTRKETKQAKYAVYVTEHFLQKRYPNNGVNINCSNVELITQDLEKKTKQADFKNRYIDIGFIGFLGTNIKGLDIAMKSFAIVKSKGYDCRLHVLGGGSQTKWELLAEDLGIADNVKFYGQLPSGKPVFDWIDKIDIYVHPSRQEGLPRAVIEVMSRGCPVIASKIGGIPELLNDNFLHKKNDYKKMSQKIISLINDTEKYNNASVSNYHKSMEYTKSSLDIKRTNFWQSFRGFAEKHNNMKSDF